VTNRIIPKEELSAWQRWEMGALDHPGQGHAAPEPAPAQPDAAPRFSLPTADELAQIHEQARREGFQAGHDEGIIQGRNDAHRVHTLMKSAQDAIDNLDEQIAADLLQLALGVAQQMLRGAISVKPELILPVIREAMASVPTFNQQLALVVNPDDAKLVATLLARELSQGNWRVVEDSRIVRGGCKIESPHSELDATLATRWRRVVGALAINATWIED
jgi:flagellar assembly protein FliH